MKSILHLKFIALYIIFGFLCLFTTATLTTQLITDRLMADTSKTLYREATLIASDYLPSYFSDDSSLYAVQSQLAAMRLYLESSLWFVDASGTMITSSNLENTSSPEKIEDFNPAEIGGNQYISGTYHDYFDEEVITVMAPVTEGFSTKGYLMIHSPVSGIEERCRPIMVPVYITLAAIFVLSLIFLLGFHFFVYRPLRLISEAARQYATGNLTYEIPVSTHDEMGYLSASLNYMAARLKDMDENTRLLAVNAKRVKEFSFQEAASWVKLGESSVRGRLDELTEMGILTKSGRTRSMRYTFDDPLRQVREMMDAGNVTLR